MWGFFTNQKPDSTVKSQIIHNPGRFKYSVIVHFIQMFVSDRKRYEHFSKDSEKFINKYIVDVVKTYFHLSEFFYHPYAQ